MSGSGRRSRSQGRRKPKEEREVLVYETRRPSRRSGAGLACLIIVSTLVLLIGLAVWFARYWLVDLTIIFTQDPFITAANIPYWNQPGFPIDPSTTTIGSFNWWLFFTNFIDLLPIIYVSVAVLIALVIGFQSLGATFIQLFLIFVIIFQLLKAGYLTVINFSWFGASCAANAYCINRDTSVAPTTPDNTYYIETFSMYFFVVYTIALAIFLPMGYTAAANSVNFFSDSSIGKKINDDDEDGDDLKFSAHLAGDTIITLD